MHDLPHMHTPKEERDRERESRKRERETSRSSAGDDDKRNFIPHNFRFSSDQIDLKASGGIEACRARICYHDQQARMSKEIDRCKDQK